MDNHRDEIRVLVICEHPLIQAGLCALIANEPGLRLVNELKPPPERAPDGAARLWPDILVADTLCTTPESISQWIAGLPNARVIVICPSHQHADLLTYLRVGVAGVLTYRATVDELMAAIRSVHEGAVVLQPELAQEVVAQAEQRQNAVPHEPLTEREREVLELLVQGLSNKQIAQKLYLSVRTVEGRLHSIYAKMGVHSRAEAVVVAQHQGWLGRERGGGE